MQGRIQYEAIDDGKGRDYELEWGRNRGDSIRQQPNRSSARDGNGEVSLSLKARAVAGLKLMGATSTMRAPSSEIVQACYTAILSILLRLSNPGSIPASVCRRK